MTHITDKQGFSFTVRIEHDSDYGTPWENEDGHGPVSDWRRKSYNGHRHKAPGELFLCDDNPSGLRGNSQARFYDFQAACQIARRDGWGFMPRRITTRKAWGKHKAQAGPFVSRWHSDINAAIREIYAQHRVTFPSARAYAAAAAMSDYNRLRQWCDSGWHYVGIIVTAHRAGIALGSASLWGIESDCEDYIDEVTRDLVSEAIAAAREMLTALRAA